MSPVCVCECERISLSRDKVAWTATSAHMQPESNSDVICSTVSPRHVHISLFANYFLGSLLLYLMKNSPFHCNMQILLWCHFLPSWYQGKWSQDRSEVVFCRHLVAYTGNSFWGIVEEHCIALCWTCCCGIVMFLYLLFAYKNTSACESPWSFK